MSSPRLEFRCSASAIAGARAYQEDTSRIWRPNSPASQDRPLLAVIADGMGGHVSGEVASRLAAEQYVKAFSSEQGSIDQRLEHAVYAGNDAILNAIRKEKNLNGMGSTLVAGYIDQEGLRWASVGDSMLLLFRDHKLRRMNESHSLGALLDEHAKANVISEEEARNSPRRHTLRSALTGAPIPLKHIEARPFPLKSGDWIVMASDGLETLSGDAIAQTIGEYEDSRPEELAKALLDRVVAAGHPNQDNTTVIAIQIQDPTLTPTRIVRAKESAAISSQAIAGPGPAGSVEPGTSEIVAEPVLSGFWAGMKWAMVASAGLIGMALAAWLYLQSMGGEPGGGTPAVEANTTSTNQHEAAVPVPARNPTRETRNSEASRPGASSNGNRGAPRPVQARGNGAAESSIVLPPHEVPQP